MWIPRGLAVTKLPLIIFISEKFIAVFGSFVENKDSRLILIIPIATCKHSVAISSMIGFSPFQTRT